MMGFSSACEAAIGGSVEAAGGARVHEDDEDGDGIVHPALERRLPGGLRGLTLKRNDARPRLRRAACLPPARSEHGQASRLRQGPVATVCLARSRP